MPSQNRFELTNLADMPWVEDKYLQWFGENKTSYTTKGKLHIHCPNALASR